MCLVIDVIQETRVCFLLHLQKPIYFEPVVQIRVKSRFSSNENIEELPNGEYTALL